MMANSDFPQEFQNGHTNGQIPHCDIGTKGDGRAQNGRFAAGWKGGVGGDKSKQSQFRKAFQRAVSEEGMEKVAAAMVAKACEGDVPAGRLVCEYTIGKPKETIEIEAGDDFAEVLLNAATERFKDRHVHNGSTQ